MEIGSKPAAESVPAVPLHARPRERRDNNAPDQVVQVERLSVAGLEHRADRQRSHAQPVYFERIRELPHDWNGRPAAIRLWLADCTVPDRSPDAQFVAVKVIPS